MYRSGRVPVLLDHWCPMIQSTATGPCNRDLSRSGQATWCSCCIRWAVSGPSARRPWLNRAPVVQLVGWVELFAKPIIVAWVSPLLYPYELTRVT